MERPDTAPAQASADAAAIATRAGLQLVRDKRGLALTDGDMQVRADFKRMLGRLKPANLNRELLVRAAKVKGTERPVALDATAGLGDDALLLAAAGFHVRLFERNTVIALLLKDAHRRALADPALTDIAKRMTIEHADSLPTLRAFADGRASDRAGAQQPPDVVVLDPMFPEKRKSSSAKKKLQILQQLESPCEDEAALLSAALGAHPRKVVVKRPAKGPHLAGAKPDYSLAGKAVRYDCYAGVSDPRPSHASPELTEQKPRWEHDFGDSAGTNF